MQGSGECRLVAGRVAAAVAYHLLQGCSAHREAGAADWLAKLDLALLQPCAPQPGGTIKVQNPGTPACGALPHSLLAPLNHNLCLALLVKLKANNEARIRIVCYVVVNLSSC